MGDEEVFTRTNVPNFMKIYNKSSPYKMFLLNQETDKQKHVSN